MFFLIRRACLSRAQRSVLFLFTITVLFAGLPTSIWALSPSTTPKIDSQKALPRAPLKAPSQTSGKGNLKVTRKTQAHPKPQLNADSLARVLSHSDSLAIADSLFRVDSLAKADSLRIRDSVATANATADSLAHAEMEKARLALESASLTSHMLDSLKTMLDSIKQRDSLRTALKRAAISHLRSEKAGTPVLLGEDTLFMVFAGAGSVTKEDRASAITKHIRKLVENPIFFTDSLRIDSNETTTDIIYMGNVILRLSDEDADWMATTRGRLAERIAPKLTGAITHSRRQADIWRIVWRIIRVIGVLALLIWAEIMLAQLTRRLRASVARVQSEWVRTIRFQNMVVIDSARLRRWLLASVTLGGLLVQAAVGYACLLLLFALFPWTRELVSQILSWTLTPIRKLVMGFLGYLPKLLNIVVVVAIAHFIVRGVRKVANEIEIGNLSLPGFYPDWARPTFNIVRFLIYALVLVAIFPFLPGSDSPVFKGISVFIGVLFSLGSSSAFSNIVAGLVITYMRSFKIGDRIRVGEVMGDVQEKTMLVTRIMTMHRELVTVPNSAILGGNTINYTATAQSQGRLLLHTQVTIGYDIPWRQVHDLLLEAAAKTENILTEPKPFVLQKSLDDFYVTYELNAATEKAQQMARAYSELHQHIQDSFFAAGVEILSPHYRAMRSGEGTTIPKQP